jgi:hypothetical protein
VILEELGCQHFSMADNVLLFHLSSRLYEHTSVIVTTLLTFWVYASVLFMGRNDRLMTRFSRPQAASP